MKVRKKPIIVDAYVLDKWNLHLAVDTPDWVEDAFRSDLLEQFSETVKVSTLEGYIHYPYGYVLIKGAKGELYGIHPDVFKETYEVLDDEATN